MTGKMSPDGKTIEFEFKDISGSTEYHMHHAVFTVIDANHHTENSFADEGQADPRAL